MWKDHEVLYIRQIQIISSMQDFLLSTEQTNCYFINRSFLFEFIQNTAHSLKSLGNLRSPYWKHCFISDSWAKASKTSKILNLNVLFRGVWKRVLKKSIVVDAWLQTRGQWSENIVVTSILVEDSSNLYLLSKYYKTKSK